jgi:uncharacterized phage infection (PIP) family protein YhgE
MFGMFFFKIAWVMVAIVYHMVDGQSTWFKNGLNGLTNGLNGLNGLTNGLNGLTNGLNGLTNGLTMVLDQARPNF